jgi:hypothetical protein
MTLVRHAPEEHGATGTITYVNPTRHPAMSGHWWTVCLDAPIMSRATRAEQYCLDYAASELELMDPPADGRARAEE